jgi:hypothetical protein
VERRNGNNLHRDLSYFDFKHVGSSIPNPIYKGRSLAESSTWEAYGKEKVLERDSLNYFKSL